MLLPLGRLLCSPISTGIKDSSYLLLENSVNDSLLIPWYSNCGPWTSSRGITGFFLEMQTPRLSSGYQIQICILIGSPGDPHAQWSLQNSRIFCELKLPLFPSSLCAHPAGRNSSPTPPPSTSVARGVMESGRWWVGICLAHLQGGEWGASAFRWSEVSFPPHPHPGPDQGEHPGRGGGEGQ